MDENRQQTAVEWLENELADKLKLIVLNNDYRMMESLFEQAKQMEKEQIIKSVEYGCSDWGSAKEAEQYYNEQYGQGSPNTSPNTKNK